MEKQWVDFKAVRGAVSMQAVLDHYGLTKTLKKSGQELRGKCPIHHGEDKDTFKANVQKNVFQCFLPACKAKGNVLDFVAAMEKTSIRDAALKLRDWFSLPQEPHGSSSQDQHATEAANAAPAPETALVTSEPNKPLAFQLKGIDPTHPYLRNRGITSETANRFGVGYFPGRGSITGRVVIPIHNQAGDLVAYVGRAIDDSEPKYKFPAGFHKSQELFNLHRVLLDGQAELEQEGSLAMVYLVEGCFDCMKLDQAGYPAVGLMGCSLSKPQEELLSKYFEAVVILLDGDEAGRAGSEEISNRLKHRLFVRVVALEPGQQPDMLSTEELEQLLND
jgi:DNA primase